MTFSTRNLVMEDQNSRFARILDEWRSIGILAVGNRIYGLGMRNAGASRPAVD